MLTAKFHQITSAPVIATAGYYKCPAYAERPTDYEMSCYTWVSATVRGIRLWCRYMRFTPSRWYVIYLYRCGVWGIAAGIRKKLRYVVTKRWSWSPEHLRAMCRLITTIRYVIHKSCTSEYLEYFPEKYFSVRDPLTFTLRDNFLADG